MEALLGNFGGLRFEGFTQQRGQACELERLLHHSGAALGEVLPRLRTYIDGEATSVIANRTRRRPGSVDG